MCLKLKSQGGVNEVRRPEADGERLPTLDECIALRLLFQDSVAQREGRNQRILKAPQCEDAAMHLAVTFSTTSDGTCTYYARASCLNPESGDMSKSRLPHMQT